MLVRANLLNRYEIPSFFGIFTVSFFIVLCRVLLRVRSFLCVNTEILAIR